MANTTRTTPIEQMSYNSIKLKDNKKLLNEIERNSKTAMDFIRYIMIFQKQSGIEVAKKAGISTKHFYVLTSCILNGQGISNKLCVNLAKALDIDPYLLNRIISNYSLKVYLEKQNLQQ